MLYLSQWEERYTNLVIPGFVLVEDNGRSEAPSGVDAGAGDRDGGQVNHEDRKSNREWCQNLKFKTSTQCQYNNITMTHNKRALAVKNYDQAAQLQEIFLLKIIYNFQIFFTRFEIWGAQKQIKQLGLDPNSLNVPKTKNYTRETK